MVLLCAVVLVKSFSGKALYRQHAECNEIMHPQLRPSDEGGKKHLEAAREFLWKHWRGRRRGVLLLTT